jgi:hypothetical protein
MSTRPSHQERRAFQNHRMLDYDVADDIAYSTYDIEDAFAARFLNPISILAVADSDKEQIVARIKGKIAIEFPDLSPAEASFSIDEMNASLASVFSSILEIDPSVFSRKWTTDGLATFVGGEVHRSSMLLARYPYHRNQFTSDLIGYFINTIEVSRATDNPMRMSSRLMMSGTGSPSPSSVYFPPTFFASMAKAIASVWHSPTGTHVPSLPLETIQVLPVHRECVPLRR